MIRHIGINIIRILGIGKRDEKKENVQLSINIPY